MAQVAEQHGARQLHHGIDPVPVPLGRGAAFNADILMSTPFAAQSQCRQRLPTDRVGVVCRPELHAAEFPRVSFDRSGADRILTVKPHQFGSRQIGLREGIHPLRDGGHFAGAVAISPFDDIAAGDLQSVFDERRWYLQDRERRRQDEPDVQP